MKYMFLTMVRHMNCIERLVPIFAIQYKRNFTVFYTVNDIIIFTPCKRDLVPFIYTDYVCCYNVSYVKT